MRKDEQKYIAFVKNIKKPFTIFRLWLERIRSQNARLFDVIAEIIKFILPFTSTFAPALFSSTVWVMIGSLLFSSVMYITQWALLTNRQERAVHDEKKKAINELNKLRDINAKELEELKRNIECNNSKQVDMLSNTLSRLRKLVYNISFFTHLVSDKVKKITVEYQMPHNDSAYSKTTDFLHDSLSMLENILSEYYGINICASIKLYARKNMVKTLIRGNRNISDRGGLLRITERDKQLINIKKNYAYQAIIQGELQYFAEGDLTNIKNKTSENAVFFCELGDDFLDYFFATIVMPIRLPVFTKKGQRQEILGILCVDCKEEMPQWSDPSFSTDLSYHIIADYADSLAILLKAIKGYLKEQGRKKAA